MNMHPVVQSRSSFNGYGHRKHERDNATRPENKFQAGKTNSSRTSFGHGGSSGSPSRDRVIYLTTCLIGNQVEVQVRDGSIYHGIFHATNADDFGIVLKMAYIVKDGSQGQRSNADIPSKPPSRTLVIPAKDLVQVIAKGVPITRDGLSTELKHEKQQELLTDSYISQSWHIEAGRELERWVPDDNDPECPELENIFDDNWNRGWNQFEVNETLFGVKSTFNEELYTTKLERGPKMRELEREALRLAREIEGEETRDLHIAEERGIQLDEHLEIDEESRFSSVLRGADDSGYSETEDISLDSQNDETFGGVSEPQMDGVAQSSAVIRDESHSGSDDCARQMLPGAEQHPKDYSVVHASRLHDNQFGGHAHSSCTKEDKEKHKVPDYAEVSDTEDSHSLGRQQYESSDKVALSANATAFDPSHTSAKDQGKTSSSSGLSESAVPPKAQEATGSLARPSSSTSTSDRGGATSTSAGRGLSPSSSVGSLSSEKSTLNPHAKEFKLNPNAKSFSPFKAPVRSPSPVADSPFYYPANMTAVPHMHGMPVGIGMGPSFVPQQPVMYNPQAAPIPQPYYHPNGPQYGQQMIMGQPRPVMYMPSYPAEMQFRGRDS